MKATPRWYVIAVLFLVLGLLVGCSSTTAVRCLKPDTVAVVGVRATVTIVYCS